MDHGLTPREAEIVRLAGQRLSDKEIARLVGTSHKTVQNTLSNAYAKLGVSNRRDAALQLGEIHPESPIPIPAGLPAPSPEPATGSVSTAIGGDTDPVERSLYALYAGLGRWRTPPRWPGGRPLLIVLIAVAVLILLGGAMAVLRIVFEVVEIFRQGQT